MGRKRSCQHHVDEARENSTRTCQTCNRNIRQTCPTTKTSKEGVLKMLATPHTDSRAQHQPRNHHKSCQKTPDMDHRLKNPACPWLPRMAVKTHVVPTCFKRFAPHPHPYPRFSPSHTHHFLLRRPAKSNKVSPCDFAENIHDKSDSQSKLIKTRHLSDQQQCGETSRMRS